MNKKLKCSSSQMAYLQKAPVIFFLKNLNHVVLPLHVIFLADMKHSLLFYLCLPLWIHDKFVVIMNHATSPEQK